MTSQSYDYLMHGKGMQSNSKGLLASGTAPVIGTPSRQVRRRAERLLAKVRAALGDKT
jgi:hypothetical protein